MHTQPRFKSSFSPEKLKAEADSAAKTAEAAATEALRLRQQVEAHEAGLQPLRRDKEWAERNLKSATDLQARLTADIDKQRADLPALISEDSRPWLSGAQRLQNSVDALALMSPTIEALRKSVNEHQTKIDTYLSEDAATVAARVTREAAKNEEIFRASLQNRGQPTAEELDRLRPAVHRIGNRVP